MSTQMLSCNEKFYSSIADVLNGKTDVAVVEMAGGTPQIHKNAALKFAAELKKIVINNEITPTIKLERVYALIEYVEKYETSKTTLKEKAAAAEEKAAAVEKELNELKAKFQAQLKAELEKQIKTNNNASKKSSDKKSNK